MTQDEKHLSVEQIECLLDTPSSQPDGHWDELRNQAREHLATCETCQRLVSMHQDFNRALPRLGKTAPAASTSACPSADSLNELAAGLIEGKNAEELLTHALQCDHCGPLLREAVDVFGTPDTDEETARLMALQSSNDGWQSRLAQKLASASTENPRKPSSRFAAHRARWFQRVPQWAYAAAVAVILASTGIFILVWHSRPAYTNSLLAQAYTERRTLEVRIPGAKFAPLRVERGTGSSSFDKPPSLLKAEAAISDHLATHKNDPRWLELKGRVELLEGDSDDAISSLKAALDLEPNSVQTQIDLASAYFQRAEAAGRSTDYGIAIEGLSLILKQNPKDTTALFNRAIVYEKIFLYNEAIRDWEHYLELDPSGEWAAEARSRMDGVREKMKSRNSLLFPTESTSNQAMTLIASLSRIERDALKPRDGALEENLLQDAMINRLPGVILGSLEKRRGLEDETLTLFATVLKLHHDDVWMRDFLSSRRTHELGKAAQSLAIAMVANQDSNSELAIRSADEAVSYFGKSRNLPGQLRARFEILYALKRSQKGPECLRTANKLLYDLAQRSYSWLEVQTLLEQANCRYMVGQFESARQATEAALKESEFAKYPTLYLRSLGFAAGLASNKGNMNLAWQLDLKGLGLYWNGPFDSLRAWQFYSDMGFAAEESSEWPLALALARESVRAVHTSGRVGEEARARFRLATVASSAGEHAEAEEEFHTANSLFQSLPQTASVRAFEMDGLLSLAELETEDGKLEAAGAKLQEVRRTLPQLKTYSIPFRYFKTLGRVQYLRGEDTQAESSLSVALLISDTAARSFSGDNDRDLLTWERETASVYRYLVDLHLAHRKDPMAALQVWERYRASFLVKDTGSKRLASHGGALAQSNQVPFESFEKEAERARHMELAQVSLDPPSHATLLSYAWVSNGLVIWTFDREGLHSELIPLKKEALLGVARRFVEECSNPKSDIDAVRSYGRQLYRWLVAPVEKHLGTENLLVIETDTGIAPIPFQALTDSSGQFLGARWRFLYSPGLAYAQISHSSPAPSQKYRAVAIGISTVHGELARGLVPLPDATVEAREVAEHFKSVTLLSDDRATPSAVRDALQSAGLFHFAGHSLSSTGRQGLIMSGSESIRAGTQRTSVLFTTDDIRKLRLHHCQLVVLSACSTAGSEDLFLDPEDLVGTFLRAGAHSVVATRWKVDSGNTRSFIRSFYSALSEGTDVSTALQRASLSMGNEASTSHPYFWAAFSGYGTDSECIKTVN